MGHLADQPADRLARHAGVRIERDDVADVARQRPAPGRPIGDEAGVAAPRRSRLSSCELAALPLPAHPLLLATRSIAGGDGEAGSASPPVPASVAPVEPGDPGLGAGEQRVVVHRPLGDGIGPVAEERVGDVALLVGEIVNLDALDQLLDAAGRGSGAPARRPACGARSARRREAREPAAASA